MTQAIPQTPLVHAVQTVCVLSSLGMMLSGLPDAWARWQAQRAEAAAAGGRHVRIHAPASQLRDNEPRVSFTVLCAMLLDNLIGLRFAYLLREPLSLYLRSLGLLLNLLYVAAALPAPPPRAATAVVSEVAAGHLEALWQNAVSRERLLQVALTGGAAAAVFATLHLALPKASHTDALGLLSALTAVLFAASPLANMRGILQRKDAGGISVVMSTALLVCASSWATYGMLLRNVWLTLPNMFNAGLALLQLSLVRMYPPGSHSEHRKSSIIPTPIPGADYPFATTRHGARFRGGSPTASDTSK